jgi:uncharacterized protein
MPVPRYLPDVPFPPYTFVPGRAAHPHTDPKGHSYGTTPPAPELLDPDDWRSCPAYLRGLDLFNHGYYWEAHEAWETAWNGSGRKGPVAEFLKALIKLAAAGVKAREGISTGVERHASRAAELFQALGEATDGRFAGLDLRQLRACAHEVAGNADLGARVLPESGALFPFVLHAE